MTDFFFLWKSQIAKPSMGLPLTGEKLIVTGKNVMMHSAPNTHLFSIREPLLEKDVTYTESVGNPLPTPPASLNTKEYTLKKDLISAQSVASPRLEPKL